MGDNSTEVALLLQINEGLQDVKGQVGELKGKLDGVVEKQSFVKRRFDKHVEKNDQIAIDVESIKKRINTISDQDHETHHEFVNGLIEESRIRKEKEEAKREFWANSLKKLAGAGALKAIFAISSVSGAIVAARLGGVFDKLFGN